MSTYTSADVLCPFYEKDIPKTCSLICEGPFNKSRVKFYFDGRRAIQLHMAKFCCNRYEECPWHIFMQALYNSNKK